MTQYIWFDDTIKTRSGKRVPYWDFSTSEDGLEDDQLVWFHIAHGRMELYRLSKVDDVNFIAGHALTSCYTSSKNWDLYSENPELALAQ